MMCSATLFSCWSEGQETFGTSTSTRWPLELLHHQGQQGRVYLDTYSYSFHTSCSMQLYNTDTVILRWSWYIYTRPPVYLGTSGWWENKIIHSSPNIGSREKNKCSWNQSSFRCKYRESIRRMLKMRARTIYNNDNCSREKQFGHTWFCIITKSRKKTDFNSLPQRNLELHDQIFRASITHGWEWRISRFEINNSVRGRVIRSEKTRWLTPAIWKPP